MPSSSRGYHQKQGVAGRGEKSAKDRLKRSLSPQERQRVPKEGAETRIDGRENDSQVAGRMERGNPAAKRNIIG